MTSQIPTLKKEAIVIGAGFAGLSAACTLAKNGFSVNVLEMNSTPGGRARQLQKDGFSFDMGPSWYWMPDTFEQFFNQFDKKPSDYYELERLDPGYRIYFGENEYLDIPGDPEKVIALFESIEKGSGEKLQKFLNDAEFKYETGMKEFVYKPCLSLTEFFDWRILKSALRLQLVQSLSKEVRGQFKDPRLIKILEFPVLFLGATPQNTPALYSLMNYADLVLGTWYPKGGMYEVVKAMVSLAEELGVTFHYNEEVSRIVVENKSVTKVETTSGKTFNCDELVSSADYHFTEQKLLDKAYRKYGEKYWENRTMAPSCLMYYLGLSEKLEGVVHHTLFFDKDFGLHAEEIYTDKVWPSDPLFYTSVTSVSDESVAPVGKENLVLLIPIATDLADSEEIREHYLNLMLKRMEKLTGQEILNKIIFKQSYCINDFKKDYHSFGGNAYGLANTLKQTAILKPRMKSPHVRNLYFAGQLTVPGPGVPPSIISGQIAAAEIQKKYV